MEILRFGDLLPLLIFNSERTVFDPVDRPVLPTVARPNVDVVDPIELRSAAHETVVQSLVDVDRARIDEILVAGVDLRPDANVAQAQKDDGHIGEPGADLGRVGREKAALRDRGQAPRHELLGPTGLSAQERSAVRQLDGKLGQEIVAEDPELSISRLKQKVVASEVKIGSFNAGERDRRRSRRSVRARKRSRRQRTSRCAIVQQEWAGHPVGGEFHIGRRAVGNADPRIGAPAAERAPIGPFNIHAEAENGYSDRHE